MDYYSSQISKLIEELSRLPGIGAKSAGRLAFHIINMPKDQVERLASTLVEARNNVRYCAQCCTLTDKELCPICGSNKRDQRTIMVVERPEIWRLMRRQENTKVSIMFFTVRFLRCLGSDREILN